MKCGKLVTVCALVMMLLSGCAKGVSERPIVLVPDLPEYSQAFQAMAAEELAGIQTPPCDRHEPIKGCSALGRLVVDYGSMRAAIRAATGGPTAR